MNALIINGKILKPYDSMYYVSADGDVYSTYSKKFLKPHIDKDGYLRVDIHSKHMKVHKLVYIVWIGPIPENMQINHIDDDKLHNHYSNLYAGSQKNNIKDCINNNHRCGNIFYLTLFDREKNKVITFCPASDFISYSGHSNKNGSLKKMFSKNWFKKRYKIIEYKRIFSNEELKSVTTIGDECNQVGQNLSLLEAHCTQLSEEIV